MAVVVLLVLLLMLFLSERITSKYQERLLGIPFPSNFEKKNYLKKNIQIEFEKLGLVVGDSVVLSDVCGKFNSGKVTAIMVRLAADYPLFLILQGPSGCGKSSLLNVLSGRAQYGVCTGKIIMNNEGSR